MRLAAVGQEPQEQLEAGEEPVVESAEALVGAEAPASQSSASLVLGRYTFSSFASK